MRSPVRASTLPDCGGRAMKRTSLPLPSAHPNGRDGATSKSWELRWFKATGLGGVFGPGRKRFKDSPCLLKIGLIETFGEP